jgi:hypothetical protein
MLSDTNICRQVSKISHCIRLLIIHFLIFHSDTCRCANNRYRVPASLVWRGLPNWYLHYINKYKYRLVMYVTLACTTFPPTFISQKKRQRAK